MNSPIDHSDHSAATADQAISEVALADDVLIILPVRNMVLYPGIVHPITIGRPASLAAAQEAVRSGRPVGLLLQKDPEQEDPAPEDLYRVGTLTHILRYVTAPDGSHHLVCQGDSRFRVVDFIAGHPFLLARIDRIEDRADHTPELEARLVLLKQKATEALKLMPQTPAELVNAVQSMESAGALADLVAGYLDLKPDEKQALLEQMDLKLRVDEVLRHLGHRVEVLRITRQISERTKEQIDTRQREALLREQMRTIQNELGEGQEREDELRELREAIEAAGMPPEVLEAVHKDLRRLERMSDGAAEYALLRTYLDWMVELPWSRLSEERLDLAQAQAVLDADHYDLEKVKRRILEYLAVRKLNPEGKSPILCFVGPPGVGKTSLGQSIARAMGRHFERVSLGGVHDEAEIRGHRRTYIGALPGLIMQSLRKAGTRNPVLMLDEIDKLGSGIQGDPASALLEVLDPEQNATFRDNYLGVPFDLSRVLFIATANVLDQIPAPLRDRMEVIELPGYTEEDKLEIARRYLLDRQRKGAGLSPEQCEITDEAIAGVIRGYTREAGCRNLERELGNLCRHAALKVALGEEGSQRIDAPDLAAILGPVRFEPETALRTSVPGVATGLAWTPVGGEILFVEASRAPGNGRLILTGQLGEVMKESAQAALSLLKAQAVTLGIDPAVFDRQDIHIHVPAGAIPKDGPSAGVALFTALASLLLERTVRPDVAMTGEITLRGLVLPVGGIKEKVLAAHRAGLTKVLLPARNRRDFEEIPESVRRQMAFVWLETVGDALTEALELPAVAADRSTG
jgi:ATP-dependent Lon protease